MSATSTQASGPAFLKMRYDFLEEALHLSGNAYKVATVLYREITRWTEKGPQPTAISTTYLQQETGLSRPTVLKALKEILKAQLIELRETVSRFGTRIYFLAKRFLGKGEEEGGKESSPETGKETLLVQRQLPETGKETLPIVVKKFNQYQSKPFTSSGKEPLPDATRQPAPEAACDDPKDILKDSSKDTYKESELVEEEKEEEPEEDYEPQAPEWGTVLEKLKPQISSAAFSSWFRSSRAFKREDQFIIQVESSFHKRHMQRFAGLIRSILVPMLPPSMDVFIATAEELRAPALAVAVGV